MKIMILGGNFDNTGGTERVGSMLANGLHDAGYNIVLASILSNNSPFFTINEDIKVVSLVHTPGRILYRTPLIINRLRLLLKQEKIDTLIVVETMSILFTLPATLGISVKHICWEHFNFNNDLGKVGRRLARQLAARYCDVVVTLTEKDKEYWLKGTKHKSQITVIPNPTPFPIQKNLDKESKKTILAVGRLTQIKGFDLLLKAWVEVAKSKPDWNLVIVGEGEDKCQLEKFITKNNLMDSVELVGKKGDVSEYYKQAEIYCLSSRFEGFPMVLLEALSFGLPVVSFDCDTGPAEILEGTGSILVPHGDTCLLAKELIELMSDKKRRDQIKILNTKRAKQFQPYIVIQLWIKLLNTL